MTTIAPDRVRMATAAEDIADQVLRAAWQPGRKRPPRARYKMRHDLAIWRLNVDRKLCQNAQPLQIQRERELAGFMTTLAHDGDKPPHMPHTLPLATRDALEYQAMWCRRNIIYLKAKFYENYVPRERALVVVEDAA